MRPYLDKATLKNLYFTFVYPYLIYCVEVWGSACDAHVETIIRLKKICIRTITFSCYFEQTEPLFREFEILSIKKLVIQRILLMMFNKYSLGIVPKAKSLLFTRNNEIHYHNTRHSSLLHPMIERAEATNKTFGSQAILIWNYISIQISINVTITCFKKISLKYLLTHLVPYRTVK